VHGGIALVFVPAVLVAHGLAFMALQLSFQRGGPLATIGVSTLLTNALPIAAGLTIYGETVPGGALGIVRCDRVRARRRRRRDAGDARTCRGRRRA
jgi:hypothetical protein